MDVLLHHCRGHSRLVRCAHSERASGHGASASVAICLAQGVSVVGCWRKNDSQHRAPTCTNRPPAQGSPAASCAHPATSFAPEALWPRMQSQGHLHQFHILHERRPLDYQLVAAWTGQARPAPERYPQQGSRILAQSFQHSLAAVRPPRSFQSSSAEFPPRAGRCPSPATSSPAIGVCAPREAAAQDGPVATLHLHLEAKPYRDEQCM